MNTGRGSVMATVVVFALVSVASGPLVGGVDLTPAGEPPAPFGTGAAEVRVVSTPANGSIHLDRGDFGSGTYHLAAPDAVLAVGAVEGNPFVEYVIRIPALDFADVHAYALPEVRGDRLRLSARPVEVSPKRIDRGSYAGEIEIRLQADEFELLYGSPIRVEVTR